MSLAKSFSGLVLGEPATSSTQSHALILDRTETWLPMGSWQNAKQSTDDLVQSNKNNTATRSMLLLS